MYLNNTMVDESFNEYNLKAYIEDEKLKIDCEELELKIEYDKSESLFKALNHFINHVYIESNQTIKLERI